MPGAWVPPALERGGDVLIAMGGALGEGDEDVASPFREGKMPGQGHEKARLEGRACVGCDRDRTGVGPDYLALIEETESHFLPSASETSPTTSTFLVSPQISLWNLSEAAPFR